MTIKKTCKRVSKVTLHAQHIAIFLSDLTDFLFHIFIIIIILRRSFLFHTYSYGSPLCHTSFQDMEYSPQLPVLNIVIK